MGLREELSNVNPDVLRLCVDYAANATFVAEDEKLGSRAARLLLMDDDASDQTELDITALKTLDEARGRADMLVEAGNAIPRNKEDFMHGVAAGLDIATHALALYISITEGQPAPEPPTA